MADSRGLRGAAGGMGGGVGVAGQRDVAVPGAVRRARALQLPLTQQGLDGQGGQREPLGEPSQRVRPAGERRALDTAEGAPARVGPRPVDAAKEGFTGRLWGSGGRG
jgi:hypothetical protein